MLFLSLGAESKHPLHQLKVLMAVWIAPSVQERKVHGSTDPTGILFATAVLVQDSLVPLPGSVASGKVCKLSEPQPPHLQS